MAASASGQFGADPVKGAKAILGVVGKDPSPVRVPLGESSRVEWSAEVGLWERRRGLTC